ncbi:hypothetical protein ACFLS8_00690 [Chloroflexota bacterium]
MACISADGKPTASGEKMLRTLVSGPKTAESIAGETGFPLFKVRSGLRDLTQVALISQDAVNFSLTDKGRELIN